MKSRGRGFYIIIWWSHENELWIVCPYPDRGRVLDPAGAPRTVSSGHQEQVAKTLEIPTGDNSKGIKFYLKNMMGGKYGRHGVISNDDTRHGSFTVS